MSFMTLKRALVAGATVVATAAFASPANAGLVIDFSGGAGNNSLLQTDGTNFLGSNIPITLVTVLIDGNFIASAPVTGNCFNGATPNAAGCLNFNTIANTISITGLGLTLMQGTFSDFTFGPLGQNFQFVGEGPDRKAPELLRALGLDPNTPFEWGGFTIAAKRASCPDAQPAGEAAVTITCYSPFSTDISDSPVPEPGSMVLLGSGLLGLGGAIRRRFAR
jgi:hypothetical protein